MRYCEDDEFKDKYKSWEWILITDNDISRAMTFDSFRQKLNLLTIPFREVTRDFIESATNTLPELFYSFGSKISGVFVHQNLLDDQNVAKLINGIGCGA